MRAKSLLLGSVSAVAVNAATTAAQAQDAMVPDGYFFSVEGGFLMSDNTLAEDKLGSIGSAGVVDIQDNRGYRAAISLGKRIDPFWDLRIRGSINHQRESVSSFTTTSGGSGFFGTYRTDFDFENLDFEVGYMPALDGNFNVRLFAGVRGLHFRDSQAFSLTEDKLGGLMVDLDVDSEFIGAGPRLGASASTRLGDSNFGISGMVAGAMIHGVQRTTASETVSSGGSLIVDGTLTDEEWKTILDIEGSLGLDYFFAEQTKLTLGYRAEQLFNVSGPFSPDGESANRLVHGPFLRFESTF